MQGNRDGLWSLNASMNGRRGGRGNGIINIVSQANPMFPSFNQPIRYHHPLPQFPANFYRPDFGNPSYQTQQNLNFHHQQIPHKYDGKSSFSSPPQSLPNNDISISSRKRRRKEEVVVQGTDDVVVKETPKSKFDTGESDNFFSGGSRVDGGKGSSTKSKRKVEIMQIEKAIKKTRKAVIAAGESVSSTRVSQAVLDKLEADSWPSLGVQMEDVPSLRQLMATEGRINAFIHCFIGARQIVTLYDLEVAICRNESVDSFDDLKLGPLLQHPLVLLYFPSISSSGPLEITSEEIISFLDIYLQSNKTEDDVKLDEFLNFVARQKSVKSKKKLGVRIQNLGMYVSLILDAKRQEAETLKDVLTKVHQKYHIPSSKKHQQDSVSDRAAKEIRFDSSSSGELSRGRDQLQTTITPWAEQAQQTGRKGEKIAYECFVGKYGEGLVSWVNKQSETGLPYDILIEKRDGKKEYVEVKATVSTMKDCFNLTVQEWEFGCEKGESYIIAHVLLGNTNAILSLHRNPVKLCQDGYLRLMILMPKQRNEVKVAF